MSNNLDQITQQLRADLPKPEVLDTPIDTANLLHDLLNKTSWETSDFSTLGHIAKRIDISRKLFTEYQEDWRKISDTLLTEPWLSVTLLLLYKAFLLEKNANAPTHKLFKHINVILKCLTLTNESWKNKITQAIQNDLTELKGQLIKSSTPLLISQPTKFHPQPIKELPLTVLFYEGPIARAYLETLHSLNLKPQKIIQLIASRDLATQKPVGRFLPDSLRKGYASHIQKNKIHYWPKHIAKTHPQLHQTIANEIVTQFNFQAETLDRAHSLKPLTEYCDNVTPLMIENLQGKNLHHFLSAEKVSAILFTGGGIVPASLLDIPHLRFIHIHPGYLPDIKGADCVLWSVLLTGHVSASSFYMSPGIDTGDMIKTCWLPKIVFDVPIKNHDIKTLYRSLYSFCDPWVRAYVLRETLISHQDFLNMPSVPQDENKGITFHFMQEEMQRAAVDVLFKKS